MPEQAVMAIAHRGAAAYAPENTVAAFQRALDLGALAIEFDVRLTADGIPVVLHDATLERTTNGHGLVAAHTRAQLAELDAGSWFAPAFAGETVPTLETALAVIGAQAQPVAELKVPVEPDVLEGVLRRTGLLAQTLVISFEPAWLSAVRRQHRDFRIGLLVARWRAAVLDEAQQLGAETLIVNVDELGLSRVTAAADAGFDVWCYTANDIGLVAACAALGVRGIITDRPDLIRRKAR